LGGDRTRVFIIHIKTNATTSVMLLPLQLMLLAAEQPAIYGRG